jgi:hypothetical protein
MAISATAIEIDGICYFLNSTTKTAEVTSNPKGYKGNITIPSFITYYNIEYSVTSIGNQAFWNCSSVDTIIIPNSVTFIGFGAFGGCSALTAINIPNSVTDIDAVAFERCSSLPSITIPNNVKSIGERAFYACSEMTSIVIGNGITSIGNDAFLDCASLSSLSLSCEIIDSWFAGLPLKDIMLEEGVMKINTNAFKNCTKVETIDIGSSVTFIGQRAFSGYDKLASVTCRAKVVPETDRTAFENSYPNYVTLYVPRASILTYQETAPWSGFKDIVKIAMPKHKLSYIVDGIEYKSYEVEEEEIITPEPIPTKEGYTFSGWSEIPETMPAHDVTVTGTFSINKYKLAYIVDGVEYKSYEIEFGASITPETEPTKEGYTFSGWSEIPETMPAHDVTVTGTFSVNSYKLTYMVDGEEYKSLNVEYGATITPEAEPTKEGYTFSGWSEIPETMPAHDVTVTGTFTLDTGLSQIMSDENGDAMIFTIDGRRVNKLQKNMNIIRMKDGTTRKVIKK